MTEEKISSYQLGMIIIAFFIGSALVLNPAAMARQDAWLAYLLGWLGGFLMLWGVVKIAELHPNKSLVDILIDCFGGFFGRLIALLYGWYFIHLAAEVIRTYSNYATTVTYPETPLLFFAITYAVVVIYALKVGIEVVGRISEVIVPFVCLVVICTFLVSIPSMKVSNLQPILAKGIMPPLQAGFATMILPFGEFILFLLVVPNLNHQRSFKRTSFIAYFAGGFTLFIIIFRNLLVLGAEMSARDIFPAHIVFRIIPGIDVAPLLDINMITTGVVKTCICLYAATKLVIEVFQLKNYRIIILPIMAFTVALSMQVRDSVIEQLEVIVEMWPLYSIPFQILVPIIVLLISLFSKNRNKYNSA